MKKSKKFWAYFNRIAASLCIALTIFFLTYLIFNAVNSQISAGEHKELANQPPVPSVVYDVIKLVGEKNQTLALKTIETKIETDESLNLSVRQYFSDFKNYCLYIDSPQKTKIEIDTSYFLINSGIIADFLQKTCHYNKINAKLLSEVVPYFLIQKFNQFQHNQTHLYMEYLNTFSSDDMLSQKSADILCLYFRDSFFTNQINIDSLKNQWTQIQNYKEHFARELGENGIFEIQRNYLTNLQAYILRTTNRKFYWLTFETCPPYSI